MSKSAGVPWQESSACTQQTKKSLHSRECWKNALSRSMRYFSWWKHENTKWWFLVIPHKCDRDHTNHSPKISLVLFVVTVLPGSLNRTDSDFSEPKTFRARDFQGTGLASSESHSLLQQLHWTIHWLNIEHSPWLFFSYSTGKIPHLIKHVYLKFRSNHFKIDTFLSHFVMDAFDY